MVGRAGGGGKKRRGGRAAGGTAKARARNFVDEWRMAALKTAATERRAAKSKRECDAALANNRAARTASPGQRNSPLTAPTNSRRSGQSTLTRTGDSFTVGAGAGPAPHLDQGDKELS